MTYRSDCPRSTIFDLVQFIKLFDIPGVRRNYIRITFDSLKHSWITTDMKTIWQLSIKECEKQPEAIGNDDIAHKSFFLEMVNGIVEKNPQYLYMLNFLK